ncbi:MAG: M23 family metallopeptidase [Chloroflexi bacterium]|nr:M23 family metallopeptidase [Chloroflexota bacterium]
MHSTQRQRGLIVFALASVLLLGMLNHAAPPATAQPELPRLPDSALVYGPTASAFDVAGFVAAQPGLLRFYTEPTTISRQEPPRTGAQIVTQVALDFSVNPRLLLALVEYRGGWLSNPAPEGDALDYPLGFVLPGENTLDTHLRHAADLLNSGYYGRKYRGQDAMQVAGESVPLDEAINPGTVGVWTLLAWGATPETWSQDTRPDGFMQTYTHLFGVPFSAALEPLVPPGLVQPRLLLPFGPVEEWIYTGGPHSGFATGAAWAAIDFAPPIPPVDSPPSGCYISPFWATAAGPGLVVRSGDGFVILDLDTPTAPADADEHTGWVLVYQHIDDWERIPAGTHVVAGDRLGHPSCAGGFSTGTHLHLARRYNGEWIPAQCHACLPGVTVPLFVLGEWTVCSFPDQPYQGCMTRPGPDGYRQAEQTRDYPLNRIRWTE